MLGNFNSAAVSLSEAEQALKDWGIKYEKQRDGTLFVPGNIVIAAMGLTRLPDLSSVIVQGIFDCHRNELTSLQGAPQSVSEGFYCDNNKLTSLEYAPRSRRSGTCGASRRRGRHAFLH